MAKLTQDQVREIFSLRNLATSTLSERFGVATRTIRAIKSGHAWNEVTGAEKPKPNHDSWLKGKVNVGLYYDLLKERTYAGEGTSCRQLAEYASEHGSPITSKAVSGWASQRAKEGRLVTSVRYCPIARRPIHLYMLPTKRISIPWRMTDEFRMYCILGTLPK